MYSIPNIIRVTKNNWNEENKPLEDMVTPRDSLLFYEIKNCHSKDDNFCTHYFENFIPFPYASQCATKHSISIN